MREIGTDGQYKSDLPDFMVFLNWKDPAVALGLERLASRCRCCS